jgi:signal transduction histidine kinase
MSLSVQLLLTFVSLVAGSTIVLTVAAYRSSLDSLQGDARRMARVTAEARNDAMTQLFVTRHQRAEGFLAAVEMLCGEPRGNGNFGFSEDCVGTMVPEFRTTERAAGVRLQYLGRTLATSGATRTTVVQPGAITSIVRTPDGKNAFSVVAAHGAMLLTVDFSGEEVDALFSQRAGLGDYGEVFLTDGRGELLTPLRFAAGEADQPGVSLEPSQDCRGGPRDEITYDYRGVSTVHAFRPATVLDGGCIDAHVNHAEALAPSENLRAELIGRGAAFVLMGALLSLIAAQRIAAPVRRLVDSARQMQGGRFDQGIPIGGPSEVRALGEALAAMSGEIDKLVRREQAARRDAESANRSKDHFLATLSHELRTPLNAIFGWTRLLRTNGHDGERVDRATMAIERSAEALRRLVDDLLDVSRIVSGRLRLVRAPFRLAVAVESALDAVRPQAAERRIRLETFIARDDVVILGDQQRLQQVIWNILWNAIKFTPPGGVVRVLLRADADRAEIEVTDTGVGIAPEALPEIFEWYRQAEAGEQVVDAGLGVGLALVRQLVELHGGSVRAESGGENAGATFLVTLPIVPADSILGGDPAAPAAIEGSTPLDSLSVLIVEDDREWRDAAQVLLADAGANVRVADSAAAARQALATFQPDLLVSDIAMPEEDGYALMQSLRRAGATFPAVALTALARREDAERARQAGFQVHMAKPVDPVRLVDTLATLARAAHR